LYDVLLLVLLAALALIGLEVRDAVDQLSGLGEGMRKAGGAVPFGIGSPVEDLGRHEEDSVHHLASILARGSRGSDRRLTPSTSPRGGRASCEASVAPQKTFMV
jgi:hypothetical protein